MKIFEEPKLEIICFETEKTMLDPLSMMFPEEGENGTPIN